MQIAIVFADFLWRVGVGYKIGNDANIVPYKSFAAFIIIGKVSLRRDEGIPPYRDKIPFGVYTKKAELLTALLLHFMGIS